MSDQASTIMVNTLEPQSGTTLTVGKSGQNLQVNADSLKANVAKDAGGNAIFTSNGSGTLSGLNSAFGSAQTLIQSQTASSSASISFTSGIDSTYKEYIFEFINIRPATDGGLFSFQANVDGGSGFDETLTSTWFHARHTESNSVAQLSYGASFDQAQGTAYQSFSYDAQNGADECLCGELHIFNPASTTYVKNWYAQVNENIRNGTGGSSNNFVAGYFNTTSAIDEFSFKISSGNIADGTIKMYGIK